MSTSCTGSRSRRSSRALPRPATTSTLLRRAAMLRRGYEAIAAPRSKVIIVDDDGSRAVDLAKRLKQGVLTAGNKFDVLSGYGNDSDEEEDAPADASAQLPAVDAPAQQDSAALLLPPVDATAP